MAAPEHIKKTFSGMGSRALYDIADPQHSTPVLRGLNESTVRQISEQKHEPVWMLEKRLKAYDYYTRASLPQWGPSLSGLDLEHIAYFVRPDAQEQKSWDQVPEQIRATFERLGIPEAEKELLGGVGAQYDSDVVYHSLKKEWDDQGVVFENMDTALERYPDLVKKYFMTQCVPINDHPFAMLHGAVWSGGTFIYVPQGVHVTLPLQAYFRMNARAGGQFEHTLIILDKGAQLHYIEGCSAPRFDVSALHAGCVEIFVGEGARMRYTSIENWSKNTYNLNTKRALVDKNGYMEWINGNFGSGVTMLYPCTVLRGEGASTENLGVAFAGEGQHQDTGSKVIHGAPRTSSVIRSKAVSKLDGISTYRGYVHVAKHAHGAKVGVQCDALLIDGASSSHTHPFMNIECDEVEVAHEATVGSIGATEMFYLQSRGLSEDQALHMVVSGFVEPIVKSLPLEYAVELNKLIEIEMEGSVG